MLTCLFFILIAAFCMALQILFISKYIYEIRLMLILAAQERYSDLKDLSNKISNKKEK